MKKILDTICGLGCVMSIVLAGGERADGSCCLVWTLGWMAAAVLLAWLYSILNGKEDPANV